MRPLLLCLLTLAEAVEAAGYSEPGEWLQYALRDETPLSGTSYYRLRSVDFDGSFSLSELLPVTYADGADWDFLVYPNPNAGREVNISLRGITTEGAWTAELFAVSGELLLQQEVPAALTTVGLNLPGPLAVGQYLLRLTGADGAVRSKLVVVGRR